MPRLVHLVPACILVSCVSGSAPPAQDGRNHICSASEHYAAQPDDCFATPTAEEAGVAPRAYRAGAAWTAWQGLCLVDGQDRLLAGNGVCELQESRTFRSDCEPSCGDSVLTGDEAATCIHDWLANDRGCKAGAVICEGHPDCGNGRCEYDDQHQEDACTCPEDCSIPEQYGAIRDVDGSCVVPSNGQNREVTCPCGDGYCKDYENAHSCPEDCKDTGTTSSTDDTSTTSVEPCDDDPDCGPGETPETCPEQCGECGDDIVSGDEQCDNGQANQTYWPQTPPDGACSDLCMTILEWCGDGIQNADEQCDNGDNTARPYSPTLPPDACAPGCELPGYCGDGEKTGEEPCDDGMQTVECELTCTPPKCGDGIHNPLAGEACDDNNELDGDGCSADCSAIERKVFVTSVTYFGDLTNEQMPANGMTGLELADARCQQLAMDAGLTGNFKAWLSTKEDSPSARFDTRFNGLYRLPTASAPIVANGWQGLASGTLLHAIDVNEAGVMAKGNVWTNTLPDGTKASENDCTGWTVQLPNLTTTVGYSAADDITWTNSLSGQGCSGTNRLYCFQDE